MLPEIDLPDGLSDPLKFGDGIACADYNRRLPIPKTSSKVECWKWRCSAGEQNADLYASVFQQNLFFI